MTPTREMLASVAAKQAIKRLVEVLAAHTIPPERWIEISECIIDTDAQTVTMKYQFTEYFGRDEWEEGDGNVH